MIVLISIVYLITFCVLMCAASEVVYAEAEASANISRPILRRHVRSRASTYNLGLGRNKCQ